MNICPLCQKKLEFQPDAIDYYCTTYVDVVDGIRWCHYYSVIDGVTPRRIIVIPPFRMIWWYESNKIDIEMIGASLNTFYINTLDAANKNDLMKIYNRFKNLRAFT